MLADGAAVVMVAVATEVTVAAATRVMAAIAAESVRNRHGDDGGAAASLRCSGGLG
ncbi:hypothetical protein LBMAG53_10710 [Planctomycetota bacterium]|nr:hypothetical protein LBMAG53_10710 [Planctomycetota bacterium]